MATLLSGVEPVSIEKLLPNGKDESVTKVVRDIARRAQANAEEKGVGGGVESTRTYQFNSISAAV
jgi:hypothetical protein